MYINGLDKKQSHDYKNPLLLDYWMKNAVNENIKIDTKPQKQYNKLNNYVKLNRNKKNNDNNNNNNKF